MNQNIASEIEHLYRVEKFMESISDLNRLLEAIMLESTLALNTESSSLALYDEEEDELQFFAARGEEKERGFEKSLMSIRMKMGSGVIGWCARKKEPIIINNAYDNPLFDQSTDKKTGFVTRSILAVPMINREKLIGVVEAVNKRDGNEFTEQDQKVLSVLAAQAALVIENARLYQENLRQTRLIAIGEGIAGAAHCIKNILHGISGGAYVLEVGIKGGKIDKVERGWDILKRNNQIMEDLVLDMLTYSRSREPELEPSDINKICNDIADLLKEKAEERNIHLSSDLQSDIGEVTLDPRGIYRCILNLASNALDACDKSEGVVKISTKHVKTDDSLEISVSDNGCGISDEDKENLFKVFFSTKGSKGTGLGLSVTEKIVGEHGGEIRVDSELGKGTTFTIKLPMHQCEKVE